MTSLLLQFRHFAEWSGILQNTYLVGGAVRNMLRGERLHDIDVAIKGDAVASAKKFAEMIEGTPVLLSERFATVRVVKGDFFFDISEMKGNSIVEDLSERDLTINAMALPLALPENSFEEQGFLAEFLIDPFGGLRDLSEGIIQMVSAQNLQNDPLRLLRVYRFAATLGFEIERSTREAVTTLAPLIQAISVERIGEELRAILALDLSYPLMEEMRDDGLLPQLFPEVDHKALIAGVRRYRCGEEIFKALPLLFPASHSAFAPYFSTEYRKFCLKLSFLFPDLKNAEEFTSRMKLSNSEADLICKLVRSGRKLAELSLKNGSAVDSHSAVQILREYGDDIYSLLVLAGAEALQKRIEGKQATECGDVIKDSPFISFGSELFEFYHGTFARRMRLLPLITGEDLKREFHLEPSPLFRTILDTITEMTLQGTIITREDALKAVKDILNSKS